MRDVATGRFLPTHGHTTNVAGRATPEYRSWNAMHTRCNSPKRIYYGGRGIKVCRRWNKFENFLADMGQRPEGTTLDRKDSNKGYSKANCRWATRREQQQNVRTNTNITYNGETHCISEWARVLKYDAQRIYQRLRRGWSVERTLETPTRSYPC